MRHLGWRPPGLLEIQPYQGSPGVAIGIGKCQQGIQAILPRRLVVVGDVWVDGGEAGHGIRNLNGRWLVL